MKSFPDPAPPDEPTPARVSHRSERKAGVVTILAIAPRDLPGKGLVEAWFDAGSGPTGQRVRVAISRLTLSDLDRGEGATALYEYEPHHCRGWPERLPGTTQRLAAEAARR